MLNGFIGNNLQQHETLRTIRDKRGKRNKIIIEKSKRRLKKKSQNSKREGRGKPKEGSGYRHIIAFTMTLKKLMKKPFSLLSYLVLARVNC
jgi:hypothetical protein